MISVEQKSDTFLRDGITSVDGDSGTNRTAPESAQISRTPAPYSLISAPAGAADRAFGRRFARAALALVCLIFLPPDLQLPATAADESISGTLAYVIDGDSLAVASRGRTMEVRLWGIDAPEYDQPGAAQAKMQLERLVKDRRLTLTVKDRDRYGRFVAMVATGTEIINEEMVKSGHGWVYTRYCREPVCGSWLSHQQRAREKRLGLWRSTAPMPPWQWKSRK